MNIKCLFLDVVRPPTHQPMLTKYHALQINYNTLLTHGIQLVCDRTYDIQK